MISSPWLIADRNQNKINFVWNNTKTNIKTNNFKTVFVSLSHARSFPKLAEQLDRAIRERKRDRANEQKKGVEGETGQSRLSTPTQQVPRVYTDSGSRSPRLPATGLVRFLVNSWWVWLRVERAPDLNGLMRLIGIHSEENRKETKSLLIKEDLKEREKHNALLTM